MKQLEKTAPGVTAPLSIPGTTRKSELLFACLHDVEAPPGPLLRDAAAGGARHRNSLPTPIQKLPEKKRRNIVKHLARNNRGILFPWSEVLTRKMCLVEPGLRVTELKSAGKSRFAGTQARQCQNCLRHGTGWVPLIKSWGNDMEFINKRKQYEIH